MSLSFATPDTTSEPAPSELLKGIPSLMRCYEAGVYDLAECERQARGAERLRELYSKIPFYAQRAKEIGPDYWSDLYAGMVRW